MTGRPKTWTRTKTRPSVLVTRATPISTSLRELGKHQGSIWQRVRGSTSCCLTTGRRRSASRRPELADGDYSPEARSRYGPPPHL